MSCPCASPRDARLVEVGSQNNSKYRAKMTVEKFQFCFVKIDVWIFVRVVQPTCCVLVKKFVALERVDNAELSSTCRDKLSQKNQFSNFVSSF